MESANSRALHMIRAASSIGIPLQLQQKISNKAKLLLKQCHFTVLPLRRIT